MIKGTEEREQDTGDEGQKEQDTGDIGQRDQDT